MVANPSSFDRIVTYFHALASEPFTYRDVEYKPYDRLVVSPNVFRSYTCPENCGACCMKVSLVWDRTDPPPSVPVKEVAYELNGIEHVWWEYFQELNPTRYCCYLSPEGRCGIYQSRPLPCRFELFKFVHGTANSTARALVRLPGRATRLMRIDGERGARCEITPYDPELTKTHIRDLLTIKDWMHKYRIRNGCEQVLEYLMTGPHEHQLVVHRTGMGFFDA